MILAIGAILSFSSFISTSAHARWDLNDVSYLYPIPMQSDGKDFLIAPSDQGKYGELIPSSLAKSVTPLAGDVDDYNDFKLSDFRAVAIRIDPCFHMKENEEDCHEQIRIVWQPFRGLGTDQVTIHDAGIHTFYDLSTKEFAELKNELHALKAQNDESWLFGVSTDGEPLDVHPAFLSTRTRASFAKKLKSIILSHAGSSHLVRATKISRPNLSLWWQFSGFDFPGGFQENTSPTSTVIPRTKQFMQEFFNLTNYSDPRDLRGAFVPKISKNDPEDLTRLLEHFDPWKKDLNEYYGPYIQLLEKIENPGFFNPNNLDCIHCHVTPLTSAWFKTNHIEVWQANIGSSFQYSDASFNLENRAQAKDDTRSIRSFGYFENQTVISNRVIFESAEVAKALNGNTRRER